MNWFETIALKVLGLTPAKFEKALPAVSAIIADYQSSEADIRSLIDAWNKVKPMIQRVQPKLEDALAEINQAMPAVQEVLKLVGANRVAGKPMATAVHSASQALKSALPGTTVSWLQQTLTKLGYPTVVDGDYGPQTHASVKKFQKDHKLTIDGWSGPNTTAMLRSALEAMA